jgi:hypothetical protein
VEKLGKIRQKFTQIASTPDRGSGAGQHDCELSKPDAAESLGILNNAIKPSTAEQRKTMLKL